MKFIESAQNARFKSLLSLTSSKGIKKEGLFLLSGKKLIDELTAQNKIDAQAVIYAKGQQTQSRFDSLEEIVLSTDLFNQLDSLGTGEPLLLCKLPQLTEWSSEGLSEPEILLPLGDPNNLGSAIRSCVAFGFKNIVLLTESAHPFLPKSIKSSSGAVFYAQLFRGPSIHQLEVPVISLDFGGTNIREFQWPKNFRLLVGEEGPGIPAKLKSQSLSIPIDPQVESLNASSSLSIALFSAKNSGPQTSKKRNNCD